MKPWSKLPGLSLSDMAALPWVIELVRSSDQGLDTHRFGGIFEPATEAWRRLGERRLARMYR